ncbi:lipid II:glycine glycyltransferase (peptidoglycan interpeptide bridge formation enzyme) [Clostridium algifaecis]|uniref:Lipid II:glycine glycyltransferase (Peptidoglycan interpeptide bridge formation enzyme) n=1 Tax=Clostridium algifaecis TaxID=1472040 RepID=A0ABS4KWK6_9CLOT|nr:GNAT family N-acetyltransferase [Clostridium algifaecis]MBP2033801.1 lipid II:glycine glycyltransferase (peptidoglycan interpeptide bridge formation enzyme) [Clostridium algifaecis]
MKIKFITENDYKIWDEFCYRNSYSTFWHTSDSMKYYIDSSFNIKSEQKSFIVYDNNKILACVPLLLENISGTIELSYGGCSIPSPIIDESLSKNVIKKVKKFIFDFIDKIAYENDVIKSSVYISYLSNGYINEKYKCNYLLKYGYLDISNLTCVVDLSMPEKELFSNFSKGHKSDIKKAEKNLKFNIINKDNINIDDVYTFMNYYFKVAGKKTRPINTFDNIYEWIKKDLAVLIMASYNDIVCGYSLFTTYKDTSYYCMACKDKNFAKFNVSHFLQWEAMKYLKKQKIRYLEIGIQDFSDTLSNFPTKKDIDISTFKRGFGGYIITVFKGEKFYNDEEFIKCYEERIHKYAGRNFQEKISE